MDQIRLQTNFIHSRSIRDGCTKRDPILLQENVSEFFKSNVSLKKVFTFDAVILNMGPPCSWILGFRSAHSSFS